MFRSIRDELRQRPCADCGFSEPAIMEFDHVPERGPKLMEVSANAGSVGRLRAELAKCDVVCPNCHRRRTIRRKGEKEDS